MKKIISVLVIALLALLLVSVFNVHLFNPNQPLYLSCTEFVVSFFMVFFALLLSCRVRTLGFIFLPPILAFAIGVWYVYDSFGIYVTQDVVSSILETNWNEAAPYITFGSVSSVILGICLLVAVLCLGHRYIAPKLSNILLLATAMLLCASYFVSSFVVRKYMAETEASLKERHFYEVGRIWPIGDARVVYEMVRFHYSVGAAVFSDIQRLPSGYVPPTAEEVAEEPEELDVVLMIGESVRADHLQINGYERETTPRLSDRSQQIVSFAKTCSFGLFTRCSLVGILTDAEIEGRTVHHRPLPEILNSAGVMTCSLMLDLQIALESMTHKLVEDTVRKYPIPILDKTERHCLEATVSQFERALKDNQRTKRNFFLVYDIGAHIFFNSMKKNKKFLPEPPPNDKNWKDCLPEWINAYDNNLLEIDMEVDELLERLEERERPAVFIYAADHGVSFGEDGYFGHANPSCPVHSPAIFVWCSREFVEKYPEIFQALRSNADKAVSHDHIIHTIMSLYGIHRGIYKRELDLTNPDAKETPAPADADILYELRTDGSDNKLIKKAVPPERGGK